MSTPIPPPIPSNFPYDDDMESELGTVDSPPLPLQVTKIDVNEEQFETGVYCHYHGGFYYAHALGWYRESGRRQRVVIYMSTSTCEFFALPWCDPVHSSWTDRLQLDDRVEPVPRFLFIGRSIHLRGPA
jgi:hypothetical protein